MSETKTTETDIWHGSVAISVGRRFSWVGPSVVLFGLLLEIGLSLLCFRLSVCLDDAIHDGLDLFGQAQITGLCSLWGDVQPVADILPADLSMC